MAASGLIDGYSVGLPARVVAGLATSAPGLFPAGFHGMEGAVAVYFEAAAVITVLVWLGQVPKAALPI